MALSLRHAWLAIGFSALVALFIGCLQDAPQARFARRIEWVERGSWMKVDTHVHTEFSDGAHTISEVTLQARDHGCDAIAITDHADRSREAASIEYFNEIEAARRQFPDLVVLAGLEWNVPPWGGDEHATVLLPEGFDLDLADFKRRFDDHGRDRHDPDRAIQALNWLAERPHVDGTRPVVLHNHPSRMCESSLEVFETHREWHRVNDVVVGFSGAPGHQAGDVNGAYEDEETTVDRWDPAAARVGDSWDQLLQSGTDVWAARAPSDFHTTAIRDVGDYWPGQFSETWVYVPERTVNGILQAFRAGSFFAVHGHIAREVELLIDSPGLPRPATCGESIEVAPSQPIRVALKCRIPVVDWDGRPNRIDLVELIAITDEGASVVATSRTNFSGTTHLLTTEVPRNGIVLRARGRRIEPDGVDLMFYTNPIRISNLESGSTFGPNALVRSSPRVLAGVLIAALILFSAAFHTVRRRKKTRLRATESQQDYKSTHRGSAAGDAHHPSFPPVSPPDLSAVPGRWFLGLAISSALFSVYVSLLPFDFQDFDITDAWQQFRSNIHARPSLWGGGRVDFFGNVLLLVPFGFGMMGARNASLSRPLSATGTLFVTLIVAAGISAVNELSQASLPRRVPSPYDSGAQVLGAGFGAILWLLLGKRVVSWLSDFRRAQRRPQRLELILRAYFLLLFLVSIVPLDLTIHPGDLLDKYQRGRINLIPFDEFVFDGPAILDLALQALSFVPVGMLALTLGTPHRRPVRSLLEATIVGAGLVLLIEIMQLFVFSRFTEFTDVVIGTTGVLAGAWLGQHFAFASVRDEPSASPAGVVWWLGLAALYLAIPCCYTWWPFEFTSDSHMIRDRLNGLARIPFQSLVIGSSVITASSLIVERTAMYIPFGLFLGNALQCLRPLRRSDFNVVVTGALVTVAVSAILEFGQVFIPQRVPDPTDILLATLGATLGLIISQKLMNAQDVAVKRPAHS